MRLLPSAPGLKVVMVAGSEDNRKITTADDLSTARMETPHRFIGFDVHGFAPGNAVMLGGVAVPHTQTLAGHLDADVALHALTGCVLGTIGAGDIGKHFPPSRSAMARRLPDRFLRHAGISAIAGRGGRVVHLDVTIVSPRRSARTVTPSEHAIAGVAVDLDQQRHDRVGWGFARRREGNAAQAIATVELPGSWNGECSTTRCGKPRARPVHLPQAASRSTAESCTGGLIAATTAIAGSSDVVDRGFVTYSNRPSATLGVPWDARSWATRRVSPPSFLLRRTDIRARHGSGSAPPGARKSVSVTGVAGPAAVRLEAGGLVHFGAARAGFEPVAEHHIFLETGRRHLPPDGDHRPRDAGQAGGAVVTTFVIPSAKV